MEKQVTVRLLSIVTAVVLILNGICFGLIFNQDKTVINKIEANGTLEEAVGQVLEEKTYLSTNDIKEVTNEIVKYIDSTDYIVSDNTKTNIEKIVESYLVNYQGTSQGDLINENITNLETALNSLENVDSAGGGYNMKKLFKLHKIL